MSFFCKMRCPRAVAAPRANLLCVVSWCAGRIKIIQPSEFQLWQCPNYVTCRLVSSSRPPELCMWMRTPAGQESPEGCSSSKDGPQTPGAPRPKLLPSLGQGNMSLVSANTWDESTKKKGKKELAIMRPCLVKSAVPSQRPYQPWVDEDEVDICALRRTAYMCPMYDQEERSGRGNKRVAVEALDNIPFRREKKT
ncbi:hypothetical protein J4Q44_G00370210 [Coregonus suidteri]|uniref:Uncharacterized protein n=1 Tax=Coregonus suidteri TaxID=861788 RepID=A0AAN8KJ80_9TELE